MQVGAYDPYDPSTSGLKLAKKLFKAVSKQVKKNNYTKAAKKVLSKKQKQKKSKVGNSKVSHVNVSGMLSGKVKQSAKSVSRSKFKKGTKTLSKFGMAQNGITTREEYRKVQSIYATGSTFAESRVIGHTSLPVRATYYNMWRAVLKKLFVLAGGNVDGLLNNSGLTNSDCGSIRLIYFTNWLSNNPLVNSWFISKA
ncbi:MAG: hypothetical protein H7836_18145, partial [Magnetococcus sp. YQC-3]